MALLTDIRSNSSFSIEPIHFEIKEEGWITTRIEIKKDEEILFKNNIPLHKSDYDHILQWFSSSQSDELYELVEPYIKFKFREEENVTVVDVIFNNGPVFSADLYKAIEISVTKKSRLRFKDGLRKQFNNLL